MGFTREHCIEALLSTNSLEQATEYILSHPPSVITPAVQVINICVDYFFSRIRCVELSDSDDELLNICF